MLEKAYRMTHFMDSHTKSLNKALTNQVETSGDVKFMKTYQIKQYSDIIESLTAAIFEHTGLHGAQTFLKFIGVLQEDHECGYKPQYDQLIKDVEHYDPPDGKLKLSTKNVITKLLDGYKFKNDNVSHLLFN